jgi:hypothetical protein
MNHRRRRLSAAVVALVLACGAPLPAQRASRRVFVTAVDVRGTPVTNLTAADFELIENGFPREVTRATLASGPMRIVLLVDTSSAIQPLLNNIRAGLSAFFTALPGPHEIALISTGGQLRIRQDSTADRGRLLAAVRMLASDGGGNAFMESLIEADRRFLMTASPAQWPVFVILTTDSGETVAEPNLDNFNRFVAQFLNRGGSAHAIVLHGRGTGITTDFAMNLVENSGGYYESMAIANVLPDKMKFLAAHIDANHRAMANWYELEFAGDVQIQAPRVQVAVTRPGVSVQVSVRRPF